MMNAGGTPDQLARELQAISEQYAAHIMALENALYAVLDKEPGADAEAARLLEETWAGKDTNCACRMLEGWTS